MSKDFLLGLDLGTSGVKAVLLPADTSSGAQPVGEAVAEYPLSTPQPGWSEQNPEDWWRGVGQAVREALNRAQVEPHSIAAIALSGQMHGATLVDRSGSVLRPCILWNDQRSGAECEEITQRVGKSRLIEWVANPALAGFTAPKLLWVRKHEPEIFKRVATVLLPKDYINYQFTGVLATEPSDASGTLLYDVRQRRWSDDMMGALDLPPSILPQVIESSAIAGKVTPGAAAATGLAIGTPVVAGGADNACAAIGAGVVSSGQVLTSIGTSGTIVAPSSSPKLDLEGRLHCFCHAVPDTWYLMGVVLSAGGSLRWFRDALASEEKLRAEAEGRDVYDVLMDEAASVSPGSEGLFFLPYLTGERTPHGDPDARGVFFGLSLRHGRAHLVRSVLEGVTFALRDSAEIMRELRIRPDVIRATGGGARSSLWRQLQADMLQTRLYTSTAEIGPALGAAILAGVGVGVFSSISSATNELIVLSNQTEPDRDMAVLYQRCYDVYRGLYPALAPSFRAVAQLLNTRG